MPLYICPSSRHLPIRLLQLYPLRLPSSTLQPLSSVLHTAARLIKDLSPRDHITPPLKQMYWLPIHARIVTPAIRIRQRPGHPGSPDVLSANGSLHFGRYSEACNGRVERFLCQVQVYFRSY